MRKITFLKTMIAAVMLLVGSVGVSGQTTINFDNPDNWVQSGTTLFTSYGAHAYVESGVTIQGANVLRNTTSAQDGFAGALGTYSMRIGNTAVSKVVITIAAGGVTEFSIKVRRWDGSPMPNYTVRYSENGGIDWNDLSNIDGTLLTTSDFFTYSSGILNSNVNDFLIDIQNTGTTERIMIDDFTWTGYGSSPSVAIPTFSVAGIAKSADTYFSAADVTINSSTEGATVYYTTNGDQPTTSSTQFSMPVNITSTTVFKAIAVKSGMNNSLVSEKTINIVSPAVGTLPYQEVFDGSLGEFYAFSKTGAQVWGASSYSSGTYTKFAKMSGYAGSNLENEDWLISPKFTASSSAGLQLSFASATNFAGNELELKYSTNYSGFGDPALATWTDISSLAAWPEANSSYAWVESGNVIVAGTNPVHFAFIYTSTTTAAATWQVANVNIINVPVGPTITVTELKTPSMLGIVGNSDSETIHVSGVNLTTDISLAVSGKNANRFSVSPATLTQTSGTVDNAEVTVTYTPLAEQADTATLTLSSAGATSVEIELTGTGLVLIGNGTTENPFTVADVKKLNNSLASATKYWVRGYVIGVPSGGNAEGNLTTVDLEPPFTAASAIALSDSDTETDLTKMIGVQLPAGDVRTALNLVDNTTNYKKLVKVFGTLEAYFTAAPGVKNTSEYQFLETSLPKVDVSAFKVYTAAGQLHVEALESDKIVVFDVIGKQVYSGRLQVGHNAISLPHRGVMVVKIGEKTAKVIL
jgi:hypothetical protein